MNLQTIKNELHKAKRAAFSGAISSAVSPDEFTRLLAVVDELTEQVRILEAVTPSAHEGYMQETLGAAEQERQAAEIADDNDWLKDGGVYMQGEDLGTRFVISGGEVMELVDSTSLDDEFPF